MSLIIPLKYGNHMRGRSQPSCQRTSCSATKFTPTQTPFGRRFGGGMAIPAKGTSFETWKILKNDLPINGFLFRRGQIIDRSALLLVMWFYGGDDLAHPKRLSNCEANLGTISIQLYIQGWSSCLGGCLNLSIASVIRKVSRY